VYSADIREGSAIKMYVNPFWFGVMTAIGVEVLLLIALAIYFGGRK
jgi:hypothetical protein